jgi:hypothetical protein
VTSASSSSEPLPSAFKASTRRPPPFSAATGQHGDDDAQARAGDGARPQRTMKTGTVEDEGCDEDEGEDERRAGA